MLTFVNKTDFFLDSNTINLLPHPFYSPVGRLGYYIKLHLLGSSPGAFRNVKYLFIAIIPSQLRPEVLVPVRVPSMNQIELFNFLLYLKPFTCVQTNDLWLVSECYRQTIHLKIMYISSSSCRAASTDISDPLSPLLPIVHRLWQVFRATFCILT